MLPSINQCFPDLLSTQWPATHHPVLCECRQLYVLVSVCCCVPAAHLLVLHDGVSSSTVTSMPKGPTYLELRLTEHTRRDALCGFLLRAASASVGGGVGGGGGGASTSGEETHRQVTVVCLQGLAAASQPVLSALMDVLVFGLVRVGGAVRRVPSLRIVAFCDARSYASVLPEHLRGAFELSTYMSAQAMESTAVIQTADLESSNVVNKRYMLEVMLAPDGEGLIETVALASEVARYLRHLLLVLRGSMLPHCAPGSHIPSRLPRMLRVLKVAALLFAPPVRNRGGRSHMSPRLPPSSFHHTRDVGGGGGGGSTPIMNFSHVVVSPAHVMCLLCPMVAHLFTIRRDMVSLMSGISSSNNNNNNNNNNTTFGNIFDVTKGGDMWLPSIQEAGDAVALWDAKAVLCMSRTVLTGTGGDALNGADDTRRSSGGSLIQDVARIVREIAEETFSYPECRELIRATVIRHSSPPNG